MNRIIKFRLWNPLKNEMVNNLVLGDEYWGDGDLEEPMQFTGLLDKNGKEIYEGDIVRLTCSSNKDHTIIADVEWRRHSFDVYCNDRMMKVIGGTEEGKTLRMAEIHSWCGSHDCLGYGGKNLEVIGNIYENKELLENLSEKDDPKGTEALDSLSNTAQAVSEI